MRRHGERQHAAKENRRPPGTTKAAAGNNATSNPLPRRPLVERKPCNKSPPGSVPDVPHTLKWLQATVAQSRVIAAAAAAAAAAAKPQDPAACSPPRSSSATHQQHAAPPAAQPSCSPDIVRKKAPSRDLEGCFGVGAAVVLNGDVKDRRKSKPRALLTVEPLPNNVAAAAFVHREKQAGVVARPGRASLEWISDDPDSESTTDISGTCDGSSADSSLCSGFLQQQELLDRWHHLRASKIYSRRLDTDSDASLTESWDAVPRFWHEEEKIGSSPLLPSGGQVLDLIKHREIEPRRILLKNSEPDPRVSSSQVMGAYESCHRGFGTLTESVSLMDRPIDTTRSSFRFPELVVSEALGKMSLGQIPASDTAAADRNQDPDAALRDGSDRLGQQVRLSMRSIEPWQERSSRFAAPGSFRVAVAAAGFVLTGMAALALAVFLSHRRLLCV